MFTYKKKTERNNVVHGRARFRMLSLTNSEHEIFLPPRKLF